MKTDGNQIEVEYGKMLARLMIFPLANAAVATAFCFLWVWQYHIDSTQSDQIDAIVAPWLWLVGFFVASFLSLRGPVVKVAVVSLLWAVVFSFFLWLTVGFILAPLFDPWW